MAEGYTDPSPVKERYSEWGGLDTGVTPPFPMRGMAGWVAGVGWVKVPADANGVLASSSPVYQTLVEEASATVTYIGESVPGTATATALWRIKKIDTSALAADIKWAAAGAFTTKWNDRATATYT